MYHQYNNLLANKMITSSFDFFQLKPNHPMTNFFDISDDNTIEREYRNKRKFVEAKFLTLGGFKLYHMVQSLDLYSTQQGIYTIGATSCDIICMGQIGDNNKLTALSMLHVWGGFTNWIVCVDPDDNPCIASMEELEETEKRLIIPFDQNKDLFIVIVKGLETSSRTDAHVQQRFESSKHTIQARMRDLGFKAKIDISFTRGSAVALSKTSLAHDVNLKQEKTKPSLIKRAVRLFR